MERLKEKNAALSVFNARFCLQFATTAPTGVMSIKSFCETFENIVSVTHGMEQLPDVWLNISQQQVKRNNLYFYYYIEHFSLISSTFCF